MNSYGSIQDFAKRASSLNHLYIVPNEESIRGWEETLQVNVVYNASYFYSSNKMAASRTEAYLLGLEFVSSETTRRLLFLWSAVKQKIYYSPTTRLMSIRLVSNMQLPNSFSCMSYRRWVLLLDIPVALLSNLSLMLSLSRVVSVIVNPTLVEVTKGLLLSVVKGQ